MAPGFDAPAAAAALAAVPVAVPRVARGGDPRRGGGVRRPGQRLLLGQLAGAVAAPAPGAVRRRGAAQRGPGRGSGHALGLSPPMSRAGRVHQPVAVVRRPAALSLGIRRGARALLAYFEESYYALYFR